MPLGRRMTQRALFGLKRVRNAVARLSPLGSLPEAPHASARDPWPGLPERGAQLLRGEIAFQGARFPFAPGVPLDPSIPAPYRAAILGFGWLRDLRALGTDAARLRARALVADFLRDGPDDTAASPEITGARLAAWLTHHEFFAATADDAFRQRLMLRIATDGRALSAALPAEALDGRALTALKGLVAVAVAFPDSPSLMTRAQRFLPPELARQFAPDGSHNQRSPAAQLVALADLIEIRALLQAAQVAAPLALAVTLERATMALRLLRHGDGALALFNGSREGEPALIDLILTQAARGGSRIAQNLPDGRFQRLAAGRTVLLADAGPPPPAPLDRAAHAGTLSFELSIGRERLIVNCGAPPPGDPAWHDALRATAAHSTLTLADTSSAELRPAGLGRRPTRVTAERQEANGAHWLEMSHDGWEKPFRATHRRKLYMAASGDDLRGEDQLDAPGPLPYTVRFHLHPGVTASLQQDGAALLRLPGGGFWRLRAEGLKLSLEESIYHGGDSPRRTEQIVLIAPADGPRLVKWALSRVG